MVGNELFAYAYNNQYEAMPYSQDFFKEVQKLSPDKLEFLAQEIAPYYFDGSANDKNNIKIMAFMAKSLNQNKNPISIAQTGSIDYASAVRTPLPDFSPDLSHQTQQVAQQPTYQTMPESKPATQQPVHQSQHNEVSDFDIGYLNQIINAKTNGLRPNYGFYYGEALTVNAIQPQGFKFHISANTPQEFGKMVQFLSPLFNRMGVPFKIADPKAYFNTMKNGQQGKFGTIYPNKMLEIMLTDEGRYMNDDYLKQHFNKEEVKQIKENRHLFPEVKATLFGTEQEPALVNPEFTPPGDLHLGGKLFVRYGREKQQTINVENLTDYQRDSIANALIKAGLITDYHQCNSMELSRLGLTDKHNNLKFSFITAPNGELVVDPKVHARSMPSFISEQNISPAEILFHNLLTSEKFKNNMMDEKTFLLNTHLGVVSNDARTSPYVIYEYGSKVNNSCVLAKFLSKNDPEKLKEIRSEIDRAIYYQTTEKTDFTYNTHYFENNGKNYVALPKDTARVLDNYLARNPQASHNIRLADCEEQNRNRNTQEFDR